MNNLPILCLLLFALISIWACNNSHHRSNISPSMSPSQQTFTEHKAVATLGGGCFWCTEAVYLETKGVISVTSGYAGGKIKNPTYREICSGLTGHAEVIQIVFDTTQISYADILYIFFRTHNPTTLNQQGADKGTQYRSVIFYHDEEQKTIAEKVMAETEAAKVWPAPLVTELSPLPEAGMYKAEEYHQNYYQQNGSQSYCVFVIDPKMQKFRKELGTFLKTPE
jgi:peptide-methionine (S)-S-oxide reductase